MATGRIVLVRLCGTFAPHLQASLDEGLKHKEDLFSQTKDVYLSVNHSNVMIQEDVNNAGIAYPIFYIIK